MKTAFILLLTSLITVGQTGITLNKDKSSMQITGTSSLHDWESEVDDFSVKGNINENVIDGLEVTVQTKSIKSGKSIMDDKTHDALKAKKHPSIVFKSDKLTINGNKVTGKGTLSLAGQSKPISLNADVVSQTAGAMQVKGAVDLKMTDFGIDPPTAMFGTLQTGDDISIKYDISVSK